MFAESFVFLYIFGIRNLMYFECITIYYTIDPTNNKSCYDKFWMTLIPF